MPIPWWAAVYLGGYAALALVAARVHAGLLRPRWCIALDLVAAGTLLTLAVAHWHPALVLPLGRLAAALLVLVGLWDGYSAWQDIARLDGEAGFRGAATERAQWAAVLVGAALVAPAYGLALSGVVQAWCQ